MDQGGAALTRCPRCGKRNRLPEAAAGVPHCGSCRAPLPWIVDSSDAGFAQTVEAARLPVLVDIWAPWCQPCRAVSPVLEALAVEYAGRLKLVKINADLSPMLSSRFDVRAIPTLLLFRDGALLARQIGAAPAAALRTWLGGQIGPPD